MDMKPITPRAAREALDLTVDEVVRLIPCSRTMWYNVERAERWPAYAAMRNAAVAKLKCVEINGKVYAKSALKAKA